MTERPMSLFSRSLAHCSPYELHLWGRRDAFCETGFSCLLLTAEVKQSMEIEGEKDCLGK